MPDGTCSVDGCAQPVRARGLCRGHNQRMVWWGDPLARVCSIDGCDKAAHGRGWCGAHYIRWRKYGDPLGVARRPPAEDRFWSHVDRSGGPDACWPWLAGTTRNGYGTSAAFGISKMAHRAAYEVLVGPIPEGLVLDHTCHDPTICKLGPRCPHRACVNPAHLEPVTGLENFRRAGIRKATCQKGHSRNPVTRRCDVCRAAYDKARWPRRRQAALEARLSVPKDWSPEDPS